MARKTYTDDERANALAVLKAEGGNVSRTSELTGVKRETISNWSRAAQPDTPIGQSVTKKTADLATLMEAEIRCVLGEGLDLARALASYKDRVTAAAILTDKVQLLRGAATGRTEVTTLDRRPSTDDELQAVATALARRGITSN